MSSASPRIAVLLDENTSADATLYEAPKKLFASVAATGAMPCGVPYLPGREEEILDAHDGLISPGGRFEFPKAWYVEGRSSPAPWSERCEFDVKLTRAFLEAGKPVLGICSGMQMMAGLAGCKLAGDTRDEAGERVVHNGPDCFHDVSIEEGTRLADIMGARRVRVNSLHSESVVDVAPGILVTARAPDGVIEAIELQGHPFAIGVQWHQERYFGESHAGNALFEAFVGAAQV